MNYKSKYLKYKKKYNLLKTAMVDGGAYGNQPGGVYHPLSQRLDNLTVSELRNMFLAYGRNNPLGRSAEQELKRKKREHREQFITEKLGPKIRRARYRAKARTEPYYQPYDYKRERAIRNASAFMQGRQLPYTVEDTGENYVELVDPLTQRHPFVRNPEGDLVTDTHNPYSQRPERQQGLKKRVVDAWKRKV